MHVLITLKMIRSIITLNKCSDLLTLCVCVNCFTMIYWVYVRMMILFEVVLCRSYYVYNICFSIFFLVFEKRKLGMIFEEKQ